MKASSWVKKIAQRFSRMDDAYQLGNTERRLDAGETMILTEQLTQMMTELFDIERLPLEMRTFFPVKASVSPGADTLKYTQYEFFGQAKKITNFSDDLPLINGVGREFPVTILSFGDAFEYSFQDLRAAAMAGVPLTTKYAEAARYACDLAVNDLSASGDTDSGKTGAFNHASVPLVTPITGTWSGASSEQIINDMQKLYYSIRVATKKIHNANAILTDTTSWTYLQRKVSTYSDVTIEQWLKNNLKGLQLLDSTELLDLADAGGTGPRIVAYERNQRNAWIEIPQDFEMFSPQEKNLAFWTPCHIRSAGFIAPYPLSIAYMDGV